MSKSQVITARIDPDTMALVDRVAKAQGRSRSWLAARAIERMAQEEANFLDFIQKGEDDIARGDFLTQEEMEAWITERVQTRAQVGQAAQQAAE
ncbi:CopG family ribbon-helix-helix protein [Blastomonas sp.]|uniref:CopG family ribbon-helix-helix protein n=1 Tax=Blastomonas sp. TaxID=1909299 RepID=UPI00359426F1